MVHNKMLKKSGTSAAEKAWSIVRLALLWARKGGVFRRRLLADQRVVPGFLKSIIGRSSRRDSLLYRERELSFEKTPVVRVRMHRPHIRFPCMCMCTPEVDFDCDLGGDSPDCYRRITSVKEEEEEEEGGIDARAEEFIERFYEQMRLQRQISYIEYNSDAVTEAYG